MYFAWLGFYTSSMLYPAVIGLLLWMLSEADQVSNDMHPVKTVKVKVKYCSSHGSAQLTNDMCTLNFPYSEKPRHLLCRICPLQCHMGDTLPGTMEEKRSRAGISMGDS